MELQQLRYVVAVAETGNFTRAAEKCFVAQPSLSQQVLNLEEELGHKLFHRLGRKAVPTEAGVAFVQRARQILIGVENASREIKDDPSFGRTIAVGAIPTVAPYLLPDLLKRCRDEHANLRIHVREDFRSPLCKAVLDGDLDLALVSQPVNEPQLLVEPLFSEPLMLVVDRSHPLAMQKVIHATDLADQTFVLLGDSSALTSQIQRFCGEHNFVPKIGYRLSQVKTVKALVELGFGISILPKVARSTEDTGLMYRELSGRAPVREIVIVRHMLRYQSRGAELFLTMLRNWVSPNTPPIFKFE